LGVTLVGIWEKVVRLVFHKIFGAHLPVSGATGASAAPPPPTVSGATDATDASAAPCGKISACESCPYLEAA